MIIVAMVCGCACGFTLREAIIFVYIRMPSYY